MSTPRGVRPATVAIGANDGAAASLAVGALEPDQVYESCGTSDMVSFISKKPCIIPEFTNRCHVVPGRWASNGVMSTPGAALQWFRDRLYRPGAGAGQGDSYEAMSREAEESPPGANGLIFLPYMMGERSPIWDPHARGVFFGLSLSTTRADMIRAILEGAAYGLRQMFEIAESRIGRNFDQVIAVGGGRLVSVGRDPWDSWTRKAVSINCNLYGVDATRDGEAWLLSAKHLYSYSDLDAPIEIGAGSDALGLCVCSEGVLIAVRDGVLRTEASGGFSWVLKLQ